MAQAVYFEAQGRTWTLRFDFNALCRLEEEFDQPIAQITARLGAGDGQLRLGDLRRVFAAGLGGEATQAQAGELIGDLGLAQAGEMIGRALTAAFPEAATNGPPGAGDAAGTTKKKH